MHGVVYMSWTAILLSGVVFSIDRYQTEILLQKYNFISNSWLEYARNATAEEYLQAVTDLQYMASLPETGDMDDITEQMLMSRRCGRFDNVEELRNGAEQSWTGWKKQQISWAIIRYLPDNSALEATQTVMQNAFNFWASKTEISFREVIGVKDELLTADILIKFDSSHHGDSLMFDGEGGIVGHATYPGELDRPWIHFDSEERWSLSTDSSSEDGSISLFKVAVHEIGHVLGLRHSTDPDSIMFAWFDSDNVTITTRDKQTLEHLYNQELNDTEGSPTITPEILNNTTCPGTVDAVLNHQNAITFVFKNDLLWRVDQEGNVLDSELSVHKFWYGLPGNLTKIDAAYYHTAPSPRVTFFIGNKYFDFGSNQRHPNTPAKGRPITDYCLPSTLQKVDAVFVWGRNQMTYIISGNMYWRFDEVNDRLNCSSDSPYPRDMSVWGGVKLPVDAAFSSADNSLYFFKNKHYWRYSNELMRIEENESMVIDHWLGCTPPEPTQKHHTTTTTPNAASRLFLSLALVPTLALTQHYLL